MTTARKTLAVVSMSTGKDSGITAARAVDALGIDNCRFVFADTGNEHELVYQHLAYLRTFFGEIATVKADFAQHIARKRIYVETVWPSKGVPDDIVQRALGVLHPTGVPFLDLCLWKGRFPSRMAQFCTQELKRGPLDAYMMELLAQGFDLESWRGIRRDESQNRRDAVPRERAAEGWTIVHPIVDMTAGQVIAEHHARGLKLNPLYSLGMKRVGCMPCINCGKDELLEISRRFPEHIDKIREWERLVSLASKRQWTTFFCDALQDAETDAEIFDRLRIDQRVKWAQTARGGRQADFIRTAPQPACSSLYGLCE